MAELYDQEVKGQGETGDVGRGRSCQFLDFAGDTTGSQWRGDVTESIFLICGCFGE